MPAGSLRLTNQTHPCLGRRPPPLFLVAWQTAGHDVLPSGSATHRLGYNVVVGEVTGVHSSTTILAFIFVPDIDVFPREANGVFPEPNKVQESNYSRQSDRQGDGPHPTIISFQNFHFVQGEESNRPFPGDYSKWLIGSIEQENSLHKSARPIPILPGK